MKTILFILTTALLSSARAALPPSVHMGNISMGGTDCRLDARDLKKQFLDGDVLRIPASISVQKASGEPLKRGSCNFALPISVPEGQKMVVSQLMVPGFVNLSPGTSAQLKLEIFKAGSDGEHLVFAEKSMEGGLSKPVLFEKDEVLFESACGENFTLRGNSSLFLSEGVKKSTASMDLIQLKVQLKSCVE